MRLHHNTQAYRAACTRARAMNRSRWGENTRIWRRTGGHLLLCTLLWTPTTTLVDGQPVPGPVRYLVYHTPAQGKDKSTRVLADVDVPTLVVSDCPAGHYWVTAYSVAPGQDESAPSNAVTVKPGKGQP